MRCTNSGGILEFVVGDKVIYPNHGLGIVERIEEKTILGTTYGFYSLRMTSSDTTVLVPLDNVEGVGLRPAIADTEVKKLFLRLGNGKIEDHLNWKGRFKDNSEKMRTGAISDVIDVLKSLNFLSKSKSLSFREKRMLDRARFLVISEVSEVTGDSAESVEDKVGKALDRCLVNRSLILSLPKTSKAKAKAKALKVTTPKAKTKTLKVMTPTAKTKTPKVMTPKAKTKAKTLKAMKAKTLKVTTPKAKKVEKLKKPVARGAARAS
jgi:CarD family transcriptional regulator